MTLVKYNPRLPALGFSDDMDRLFNRFWQRPLAWSPAVRRRWIPAFDIRETDEQILLSAALPGLSKKDIEVSLHDGVLTVTAEREERETAKNETVHYAEQRYGKFARSFSLPTEVDEDKVEARYNQGILSIALNKLVPVADERKRIAIK